MNVKNEIKSKITAAGMTLTEVVELLNKELPADKKTTVQSLSNKLTRGTIRYDEVKAIAKAIGMEIQWIKIENEDN